MRLLSLCCCFPVQAYYQGRERPPAAASAELQSSGLQLKPKGGDSWSSKQQLQQQLQQAQEQHRAQLVVCQQDALLNQQQVAALKQQVEAMQQQLTAAQLCVLFPVQACVCVTHWGQQVSACGWQAAAWCG
jgi:hypothetical protein